MLDIGISLRRFRDHHKFSQQQVANLLGISRTSYRKWENNEVDFSLSQLFKIAEVYGITVSDIIFQANTKLLKC